MTGILQSGNVTPGHSAIWTTDGVVQDGGAILASNKVIASLRQANFNTVVDQPIVLPRSINTFQLTGILVTNASVSLTTAVGGFYSAAQKGGSAFVSAGQVYSSLTSSSVILNATLAAYASSRFSNVNLALWTIYFSLTTAQGAAAVADIYLIGLDLS